MTAESEKDRASAVARAATCFGDAYTTVRASPQSLTDEMEARRRKAAESSAETLTTRDAMRRILSYFDMIASGTQDTMNMRLRFVVPGCVSSYSAARNELRRREVEG